MQHLLKRMAKFLTPSQQILKHLQINRYARFTLRTFLFKECTPFSCKQKPLQLHTFYLQITPAHLRSDRPSNHQQAITVISNAPHILRSLKQVTSRPLLRHIASLCTPSADRVLFRHALCASLHGSASPSCRPPQHPPLLSGRHPEKSLHP